MALIPLEWHKDHHYDRPMSGDQVSEYADKIRALMTERLRIKGRSLEAQIKKSGRRLPRRIKRQATQVAKASAVIENPKLSRMVDQKAVQTAAENVIKHLQGIDPKEALKDRVLWALGKFSAVLILAVIIGVWVARSRGMI